MTKVCDFCNGISLFAYFVLKLIDKILISCFLFLFFFK